MRMHTPTTQSMYVEARIHRFFFRSEGGSGICPMRERVSTFSVFCGVGTYMPTWVDTLLCNHPWIWTLLPARMFVGFSFFIGRQTVFLLVNYYSWPLLFWSTYFLEPGKHLVQSYTVHFLHARLWLYLWVKVDEHFSSLTCLDYTQLHIFNPHKVSPSLAL